MIRHLNITDDMTICKEEIFGPVLCLLAFTTDEEVIHRANLSPYGLASGIFTSDIRRGHALASQVSPTYTLHFYLSIFHQLNLVVHWVLGSEICSCLYQELPILFLGRIVCNFITNVLT